MNRKTILLRTSAIITAAAVAALLQSMAQAYNGGSNTVIGPSDQMFPSRNDILEAEKRIAEQWQHRQAPLRSDWRNLVVAFVLQPDGSIEDLRMERSSGKAELDAMALQSVCAAAPFQLKSLCRRPVLVEVTFARAQPSFDGDGRVSAGTSLLPEADQLLLAGRSSVPFGPYVLQLKDLIAKSWHPQPWKPGDLQQFCVHTSEVNWSQARTGRSTHLSFRLDSLGRVSNLRLTKSCGDRKTDQAALQAIKSAAPFPRLPEGAPPHVELGWSFEETDRLSLFIGTI